jgi:hypothetical protein
MDFVFLGLIGVFAALTLGFVFACGNPTPEEGR